MIKKYPLIPFLIFAGALISTATIGLPVFAGWHRTIIVNFKKIYILIKVYSKWLINIKILFSNYFFKHKNN